jgi:superfamily II DNA/RNA helicase
MSGNDYSETGLREIIDTPEFTEMAIKAMEEMNFQDKQTAVYCAGIEHAENFAKALKKKEYECEVVHSKRPQKENDSSISNFKNGKVRTLISVSSLLIGFDAPNMELLVSMRPTRILRLWLQLGGRVLRTHKGKEYGEILDLGQCVSSLGFLEDTIPLVAPGEKKKLKKEMEKRSKPVITMMAGEAPTEMQREIVLQKIEELEKKARDYTKQTTTDIMGMFELEDDFKKLALYALEIESRIKGTRYGKYTATWIAAPWKETANKYPQHERLLINQFKKQAKGKIRRGSKIAGLHYTVAWLIEESDLKHLFGTSWQRDMIDIDEDDIPF